MKIGVAVEKILRQPNKSCDDFHCERNTRGDGK